MARVGRKPTWISSSEWPEEAVNEGLVLGGFKLLLREVEVASIRLSSKEIPLDILAKQV